MSLSMASSVRHWIFVPSIRERHRHSTMHSTFVSPVSNRQDIVQLNGMTMIFNVMAFRWWRLQVAIGCAKMNMSLALPRTINVSRRENVTRSDTKPLSSILIDRYNQSHQPFITASIRNGFLAHFWTILGGREACCLRQSSMRHLLIEVIGNELQLCWRHPSFYS